MLATLRVPLAVAAISFIAPYAAEAQRGGVRFSCLMVRAKMSSRNAA